MNLATTRRWPRRFSLRSLFIAVTLGCMTLGPLANRVYNHHRALDHLAERRAVLVFGTYSEPAASWRQDLKTLLFLPSPCRVQLEGGQVAATDLSSLQQVVTLESLTLSETPVRDDWLPRLQRTRQLQMLDLSNSQVSDAGLPHLGRMKKLKRLYLENTRVTAAGVEQLRRELPNCEIVF